MNHSTNDNSDNIRPSEGHTHQRSASLDGMKAKTSTKSSTLVDGKAEVNPSNSTESLDELEISKAAKGIAYCRRDCGFYGSTKWEGYCSKCYRIIKRRASFSDYSGDEEDDTLRAIELSLRAQSNGVYNSPTTNIASSFLNAASSMKYILQDTLHTIRRDPKRELAHTRADFQAIMKDPSLQDIVVKIKAFVNWMLDQDTFQPQDQVEEIQRFMQDLAQRVARHPTFKGAPQSDLEWVVDGMERHVLNKLYRKIFNTEANRQKDQYLQDKLGSLQWITCPMLVGRDCPVDENEATNALFDQARIELVKMSTKRQPLDKLLCILQCSRYLQEVLGMKFKRPTSADEFLPILIYTVITANPPSLHSNLQYISAYCKPSCLSTGEMGYYFTNLCGAVSFLDNLNHTTLEMDRADYDRQILLQKLQNEIKNINPRSDEEDISRPIKDVDLCNTNQTADLLNALNALRESQAQLWMSMKAMSLDMDGLGWPHVMERKSSRGAVSVPHVAHLHPSSTDASLDANENTTAPPTPSGIQSNDMSYANAVKQSANTSNNIPLPESSTTPPILPNHTNSIPVLPTLSHYEVPVNTVNNLFVEEPGISYDVSDGSMGTEPNWKDGDPIVMDIVEQLDESSSTTLSPAVYQPLSPILLLGTQITCEELPIQDQSQSNHDIFAANNSPVPVSESNQSFDHSINDICNNDPISIYSKKEDEIEYVNGNSEVPHRRELNRAVECENNETDVKSNT